MSGIVIRRASLDEAAALTDLIHASKRHWGYDESLISLWSNDLTLTPQFIRENPVFVAEDSHGAVGVYALLKRPDLASLEHMWIHPDAMGRGIGRRLFDHAVETAVRMGIGALEIVSDPNAEGFYLRMGARRDGAVPSRPPGRKLPRLIYDVGGET